MWGIYLEQIEFFEFRHDVRLLHVTEDEPDDAAEADHEVEGGQDDAKGIHGCLQLTAASS